MNVKLLLFCDAAKKKNSFGFYTGGKKNKQQTALMYGGQIFNLSDNIE